jgi:succinyl-CoA synthetase beta subunit
MRPKVDGAPPDTAILIYVRILFTEMWTILADSAMGLIKGKRYLRDEDAFRLLGIYGISVPPWAVVEDLEHAKLEAERIGFPLVMKVSPDEPTHKTDIGGVRLNVGRGDLGEHFAELSRISKKILLQHQLSGAEIFVGGIRDRAFGPAVLVGLGGIYVEVFRSISYGLAPVSEQDALEMMSESRVMDILAARKRKYDVEATARTIVNISRMMMDLPIKELDINPLIVNENGAFAADARIVL